MSWKKFKQVGPNVFILWLTAEDAFGQGFLVDQASGTLDEIVTDATRLPDNQIAQSFTPSLSVVGFVQFSQNVPAFVGNDQVNFVVNLRQGAYNGPATEVGHLTRLGRREAKGLTHAGRGQRPGTCLAPY